MVLATGLTACASFNPVPVDQLDFRDRAITASDGNVTVRTAVLSRDEAQQLFDAKLHNRGVQPIWIEVSNQTDHSFWLMLHGIDPSYFSAREVAYMNH